jgi:predicted DsbA family dithiol-disulfide isomerase
VDRLSVNFAINVRIIQFPLHPETPQAGLTLEQLFAERDIDIVAAQDRMKQLMAAEGLPYGERTMTYNSRLAQELVKWAESQPGGQAIHDVLFRAYFVNGVNIALSNNLVSIAEQVGLDADQASEVLAGHQMRDAVDADWQRSRELGVTGVPTFVLGGRGITGAQPYEVLERMLVDAGTARRK